jgi:hypothetical protein
MQAMLAVGIAPALVRADSLMVMTRRLALPPMGFPFAGCFAELYGMVDGARRLVAGAMVLDLSPLTLTAHRLAAASELVIVDRTGAVVSKREFPVHNLMNGDSIQFHPDFYTGA